MPEGTNWESTPESDDAFWRVTDQIAQASADGMDEVTVPIKDLSLILDEAADTSEAQFWSIAYARLKAKNEDQESQWGLEWYAKDVGQRILITGTKESVRAFAESGDNLVEIIIVTREPVTDE